MTRSDMLEHIKLNGNEQMAENIANISETTLDVIAECSTVSGDQMVWTTTPAFVLLKLAGVEV